MAVARYLRVSPKKVNRLLKLIRLKSVAEAEMILKFLPHSGARYVQKVLKSAVANAENNNNLNKENLIVSQAITGQGVILKRYRAGGKGSAAKIMKPTAHITIAVKAKGAK